MDDKDPNDGRPVDRRQLAALLPRETLGWKPEGPDGVYTRDTLFELIDGGAEVYRSLNVQRTLSRHYVKAGAPDIIADVFDMGTPEDAFGAYHHDMHEGKDARIGRESEFLGSSLTFWKDRYFVSIVAFDETEEIGRALLELGSGTAARIRGDGDGPDLVQLVPGKSVVSSQVHYFHDKMLLDRHYSLGDKNILGLDSRTEVVLARCRPVIPARATPARKAPARKAPARKAPAGEKAKAPLPALLIVRYPSEEKAKKAHGRFMNEYLRTAAGSRAARTEKGLWAGADVDKDLFIGVLDAPDRNEIERLISEVRKKRSRKTDKVKTQTEKIDEKEE